jgi:hypothetical protein
MRENLDNDLSFWIFNVIFDIIPEIWLNLSKNNSTDNEASFDPLTPFVPILL